MAAWLSSVYIKMCNTQGVLITVSLVIKEL
jgi:hypothetical protein